MILNLSKLLTPTFKAKCLLVSGNEDCSPLINYIGELCFLRAGELYQRKTFVADRYFNFQIIDELIQENSLFGDRNFINIQFKTKPTVEQQKQLVLLLPQLDENNVLFLSCDKLDKKDQAQDWVQQFNNNGELLYLAGDLAESKLWSLFLFANAGLEIELPALDLLLSMNQNNLAQLQQEVTKLCLIYPAPHSITLAEAQENLLDNAQFNVFALSHAYLAGNVIQAKKIYANICSSTEDAILILWSLGEDLRKLIKIKAAQKTNPDFNAAINGLRIWGDGVANFRTANQRISYQKLLFYFNQLAEIDCCIKGIKSGDALIQIERLIINFSQGA